MKNTANSYYLPAEWHPQVAVQLTWPHADTDWAPYLDDIKRMEIEMAKQITLHENLIIATPEPDAVRALLASALSPEQMAKVSIYNVPTNDTWARDHAPLTLLPVNKADSEVLSSAIPSQNDVEQGDDDVKDKQPSYLLADFQFNGWGEKFAADKDNLISRNLHNQGAFDEFYGKDHVLQDNNDLILEGGAVESDGKGTVFTTSFCLLAPHRNQPMTRADIEEELKKRLCAQRIVWIDHGQLIGDDTDGHIDTIVRPAPDDTLLYVKCYDESDEQYDDFKAMEEQLKTFRTMEGKPYRLLPLPMPRAMYDDGDRLPATYANFLIVNDAVLVPTYGQSDLDKQALDTIAEAFPGREVVGIDAQVAVRQHGSLHCLTMQYPKL